ncbi:MAG: REP-associated tyrosine transposase [Phycisphaeraceae bacterium]
MAGPKRTLKRYEHRNEVRYLTCSCYKQLALFKNRAIRDQFVEHLRMTQEDFDFRLYAWVLMPEHFHLLIRPAEIEQAIAPMLRRLKAGLAKRVIQRWRELDAPILGRLTDQQGATRFWQRGGGYDRNLYREEELVEKITYIHFNPVRRELVSEPGEWKWSSARAYETGEDDTGLKLVRSF